MVAASARSSPEPAAASPAARHHPTTAALAVAILVVLLGLALAGLRAWMSDDAYISVRYARMLVAGHGLVFNPGEPVEGFTNLAWTLMLALGLAAGVPPAGWAIGLGLAAHTLAIGLLARASWRLGAPAPAVPIAALVVAITPAASTYATAGLEGGLLALCLTGWVLALERDLTPGFAAVPPAAQRRPAGAAATAWLGLALLTRPDAGVFVAAHVAAYVVAGRVALAMRSTAALAGLLVALTTWRLTTYGAWVPNTYLAKSAHLPWWDQGARYLQLFIERHGALLLGPALAVVAFVRDLRGRPAAASGSSAPPSIARHGAPTGGVDGARVGAVVAIALYMLAVVRVGGDFMEARLFAPLTPLFGWTLERELRRAARSRRARAGATALGVAMASAAPLLPRPVTGTQWRYGIADEAAFYNRARVAAAQVQADALALALHPRPVRVAFLGGLARVIDGARVPWATDAETGLTHPLLAGRVLTERGRPGHEKRAQLADLRALDVGLLLGFAPIVRDILGDAAPYVPIVLAPGSALPLHGALLRWDPPLVQQLRDAGAEVHDFVADLDRAIAALPRLPPARAATIAAQAQAFYFDHVADPPRAAAFAAALAAAGIAAPTAAAPVPAH
jgi:arabinofuranosyltransferase